MRKGKKKDRAKKKHDTYPVEAKLVCDMLGGNTSPLISITFVGSPNLLTGSIHYPRSMGFMIERFDNGLRLVATCKHAVQFFWMPLLLEAKQTYISEAVSSTRLLHSFPVFSRLFWPTLPAAQVVAGPMLVTDFTTTLGISLLLLLAGGFFVVTSKKRTISQFFWLAIILVSIFFMHPV